MDAIQRRTIVGMTGLVALWVVVYWAWQPRADRVPTVTFTEPVRDSEEPPVVVRPPEPEPVLPQPVMPEPDPSVPSADELFGEPPFR